MKEKTIKVLFIAAGLSLLAGIVLAALSFEGSFGDAGGENNVSLSIRVGEEWELYLMLGLIIGGIVGLAVAGVAWLRSNG